MGHRLPNFGCQCLNMFEGRCLNKSFKHQQPIFEGALPTNWYNYTLQSLSLKHWTVQGVIQAQMRAGPLANVGVVSKELSPRARKIDIFLTTQYSLLQKIGKSPQNFSKSIWNINVFLHSQGGLVTRQFLQIFLFQGKKVKS